MSDSRWSITAIILVPLHVFNIDFLYSTAEQNRAVMSTPAREQIRKSYKGYIWNKSEMFEFSKQQINYTVDKVIKITFCIFLYCTNKYKPESVNSSSLKKFAHLWGSKLRCWTPAGKRRMMLGWSPASPFQLYDPRWTRAPHEGRWLGGWSASSGTVQPPLKRQAGYVCVKQIQSSSWSLDNYDP